MANIPEQLSDQTTETLPGIRGEAETIIRQLFDDYLRRYASRDDSLVAHFSENFSGFTGGGDFLVKQRDEWVAITRQDFAQVKDPIRIELKDVAIQSLTESIAVVTGFFTIHLPIKDHILSRETARLVLIFRLEPAGWKIAHSSISIPYQLVQKGEVYPLKELVDRNRILEEVVAERTIQLSAAISSLQHTNEKLAKEIAVREQTGDALQKSEERYRSILAASPDDITILDREGRIVMVSPAAFAIFGFENSEEFVGRPVMDYLVPEDRDRALARIALKHQGVVTGPGEYRGLRRDGSSFDIEVNSEFIRDAEKKPTGMVIIVRDISGRKRAEAERKALEAQNRQLQKAESLGRMAGAIAHHFNNQLHGVTLGLELAFRNLSRNENCAGSLALAMKSARKAAEVSTLMLTYLGQTIPDRKLLDLSMVCEQSLPVLQAVMPEGVAVKTKLHCPGPTVLADEEQIRQILTILVTNAGEAGAGPGRSIGVSVQAVAAAEISAMHRFPIEWQPRDASYACLELADAGCGIPERDIEKIFDPFFSTKFPGRGMGLAVALGITRTLHGAITVESKVGRGSIFRVFLPVSLKTAGGR